MENGRYGIHGGQYVPETLMNEIKNLEKAYEFYKNDKEFNEELDKLNREYAGRPSLQNMSGESEMSCRHDGAHRRRRIRNGRIQVPGIAFSALFLVL